jgi:predicted nucleic-acid-binding protein
MARSAAIRSIPIQEPGAQDGVVETTLLELVQTIGELTEDDREVVATVIELLRAGRVRLIGNFRGQRIALA